MIAEMNIRAGGKIAPDFMLKLDDRDITQNFSHRLISLTMTDKRGLEADQLDILLDDSDGLLDLPARGARLSLWLGWEGTPLEEKGDFTIDAIHFRGAPDTLTIRGCSADFRGKLNVRREQSWHDTTIGAIVDTIAQRNQLTASVASGLASLAISHIDQSQETDAKWLQTRDPKQQNPQLSINRQSGGQQKEALQHPDAAAPVAGAAGKEQKPQERLVGSAENVFELTTVYASEEQALRAAEAKWRALQRGTVEFSIQLALGRADLFPETPVLVNGFKRVIDEQAWIISEVVHTLNDSGFTTQLKLELNVSDEKFTVDSE